MVARLRAAPDQKRRLRYADVLPRTVGRDDFQYGLTLGQRFCHAFPVLTPQLVRAL